MAFTCLAATEETVNSQFDNVRVTQKLQVFNLALDAADHVAANELLPGNDLEGHLLAGADVSSQSDLTKRAFPQRPNNLVRAYALLGLCLLLGWRADRLRGRTGPVLLLIAAVVAVMLVMAGLGVLLLLLLSTDVCRRQRNGQLLIVKASRTHGELWYRGAVSLGGGFARRYR